MNLGLVKLDQLGIKQLLRQGLMAELSLAQDQLKLFMPETMVIPLLRAKDEQRVFYISAIAYKLAQLDQIPTQEVAIRLATHLSDLSIISPDGRLELEFAVEVVGPGWIHFQLSDRSLADWLQGIIQGVWSVKGQLPDAIGVSESLFLSQYAHARCCSLLRLAQRERIIALDPAPVIPWLNSRGQLQLQKPAELKLIVQLVDLLDVVCCPTRAIGTQDLIKLANTLSRSFTEFHRYCQIWGEVQQINPQISIVRLGLVMVTQKILQLILETFLGVYSPEEL